MRAYQKPTMECELFAANEFIAACDGCYFVGCTITPGTQDANGSTHNKFENGTGCCWYNNQVATLGSDGSVTVNETNAPDGQGTLTGYSASWTDTDGSGGFSTGDQVTWTTYDSYNRQYDHVGQLYSRNSS